MAKSSSRGGFKVRYEGRVGKPQKGPSVGGPKTRTIKGPKAVNTLGKQTNSTKPSVIDAG